jgi:hypothetical protein
MSDYKLLKKAYLNNTNLKENYTSGIFESKDFEKNNNRPPANDGETGTLYLANSNTVLSYRVIKNDSPIGASIDSLTYSIRGIFNNSANVVDDIQNIFKELCLYPTEFFSSSQPVTKFVHQFIVGDIVNFQNPRSDYEDILRGGKIEEVITYSDSNTVKLYVVSHGKDFHNVSAISPQLRLISPKNCQEMRIISEENITADSYFVYDRIPLKRLLKDN